MFGDADTTRPYTAGMSATALYRDWEAGGYVTGAYGTPSGMYLGGSKTLGGVGQVGTRYLAMNPAQASALGAMRGEGDGLVKAASGGILTIADTMAHSAAQAAGGAALAVMPTQSCLALAAGALLGSTVVGVPIALGAAVALLLGRRAVEARVAPQQPSSIQGARFSLGSLSSPGCRQFERLS